jgi:hypothetical protein
MLPYPQTALEKIVSTEPGVVTLITPGWFCNTPFFLSGRRLRFDMREQAGYQSRLNCLQ